MTLFGRELLCSCLSYTAFRRTMKKKRKKKKFHTADS